MGRIVIENLRKEFVNRRRVKRSREDPQSGQLVTVLDGINLEFEEGEMIVILGPSGCGKSTLLRIIAGFERASSGRVMIDGKEVTRPNSDNIFVFQQTGLLPWLTVWENVELGVRHLDIEERRDLINEQIEMVDLVGFDDHYPHQLSGGMQRRAELARALVVNPNMLFMDEPFTGLDFLTHMKIREEVVNLHEFIGKTMIMVTHFIDDALIMGDRIVVMSDRPTRVKMVKKLHFERARNLEKVSELRELREELFFMLGVSYVA